MFRSLLLCPHFLAKDNTTKNDITGSCLVEESRIVNRNCWHLDHEFITWATRVYPSTSWCLPSLKLTYPLNMDRWKTSFLLGSPIFRGELIVLGRVLFDITTKKWNEWVLTPFQHWSTLASAGSIWGVICENLRLVWVVFGVYTTSLYKDYYKIW